MTDYHINVFYSEGDGCYVADIPDLKFCSAFGATAEEAVREVQLAKTAWLKAARERGKPIPKPKYRPAIYQVARRSNAVERERLGAVPSGANQRGLPAADQLLCAVTGEAKP